MVHGFGNGFTKPRGDCAAFPIRSNSNDISGAEQGRLNAGAEDGRGSEARRREQDGEASGFAVFQDGADFGFAPAEQVLLLWAQRLQIQRAWIGGGQGVRLNSS